MSDLKFRQSDGKQYIEVPTPKFKVDDKVMFISAATFNKDFYILWAEGEPNEKMIKNQISIGTISGAFLNPAGGIKWKYMIHHSSTAPDQAVLEEDVLPYDTCTSSNEEEDPIDKKVRLANAKQK